MRDDEEEDCTGDLYSCRCEACRQELIDTLNDRQYDEWKEDHT